MSNKISDNELMAFDIYFSTIVSHNNKPGKSLADCAKEALDMLTIRATIFNLKDDDHA